MNVRLEINAQPTIPVEYRLLASSVKYGDLWIDLYGTHDDEGYEVCAVAMADSIIDLQAVLDSNVCDCMTDWCSDNLPSAAELRAKSMAESRVEIGAWNRDVTQLPELTAI